MAANYVLLERIELNASAASVTFSNIPQSGYTDLKIVASVRSNRPSATWDNLQIRLNGSTTSYSARYLLGNGSSASSGTLTTLYGGDIPAVNATSQTFSNAEYYFPNYLSNAYKSVSLDSVAENNATATNQFLTAGLWSNTAAINSIEMFSGNAESFVQYSTFSLYGLAAVGTTPTIAPKAVGGNITTDGTYWYHTFLSTDAFVPQVTLSCDTLVVAGGGGGGLNLGGGGGAGGLRYNTSQSFAATSYTIVIGAGGAGGVLGGAAAVNGSNSVAGSITSTGGGAGGDSATDSPSIQSGKAGGSGGGGTGYYSNATNPGGAASPSGQGNAGGSGTGNKTPPYGNAATGGGGGAGAAGTNGGTGPWAGGAGGNGLYYDAFGAATNTGQYINSHYYYAGGGGGSGLSGTTQAAGGYGGGGTGGVDGGADSTIGTINTGGGGGGSRGNNTNGKAGGSGIVIIRYPIA